MNFYEHHIGDYQKKTAHLSLVEHGAYFLMLQLHYATEKPLPTGKVLYRMLRADSKAERAAIDAVVKHFWEKTTDGLINPRAQVVIAEYHQFVEKQRVNGKGGASKRWGSHRHSGGHSGGNGGGHSVGDGVGSSDGGSQTYSQTIAPTSHSPLPTPTSQGLTPQPPLGRGALRDTRSESRRAIETAKTAWTELVASRGAKRDGRVQLALDAVGGWQAVAQRTERDETRLRKDFVDAYVRAAQ